MNAPWTVESDDFTYAIADARHRVALAKEAALEAECFRLAGMAQRNPPRRQEILEALRSIARDHDLVAVAGGDVIARTFGGRGA
jgi:hypothetical protein